MKMMVDDHDKDVAAFRKEANGGKDPDVKAWAAKTLPTLEQHQSMAKSLAGGTKGASTKPGM
jgi:putative membrane protein